MDPWPFVIAAFGLTILATATLLVGSWRSMRTAERRENASRKRR